MAFINLTSEQLGQDVAVSETTGTTASSWWRTLIRTMQYSRMLSVLNGFSDETLAEIGVKRSDISAYAQRLIDDPQ